MEMSGLGTGGETLTRECTIMGGFFASSLLASLTFSDVGTMFQEI